MAKLIARHAQTHPDRAALIDPSGELRWDVSLSSNGIVTFDTARTKGLVGYADNRAVNLGGLVFQPGTTRLGTR